MLTPHSNHWLWFHFSLRKQQAVHLRALREMKAGAPEQGSKKKKKKMLFPLSFQIPAGCDRVVNTQDKRQLCLLVLNIPIRLPTMAAFVCSHVRMRMKIPLPRLLCKKQNSIIDFFFSFSFWKTESEGKYKMQTRCLTNKSLGCFGNSPRWGGFQRKMNE